MRYESSPPFKHAFPSPAALTEALKLGLPDFGWIDWLASTGSTNADLIQRVRGASDASRASPHENPTVVTPSPPPWLLGAHLQTSGKGRAGRPWQNVAGECLMFSCAFEPQIPLAQLPGISPALGVATCLALRSLLGDPNKLQLKWPNDIQWGTAKLAGLLIETAPAFTASAEATNSPPMIVVGMGLNLSGAAALSAHLQRPIADLDQILQDAALQTPPLDRYIPPQTLIAHLARAWQQALVDYKTGGYEAFAQAFGQVDALAGQHVCVVDQGKTLHEGFAQGTDAHGRLNILTETGVFPVLVGDVSIRAAGISATSDTIKGPR